MDIRKIPTMIQFILIAGAVIVMSGCGIAGMFTTDMDLDYGKSPDGTPLMLDTRKNWDYWTMIVQLYVRDEYEGKKPSGGMATWNDHWIKIISSVKQGGVENPGRIVNYIIDCREAAGLPPIEFQDNQSVHVPDTTSQVSDEYGLLS
jgi:hypothetical protein